MQENRCSCGGQIKVARVEQVVARKMTFRKHCQQCGAHAEYHVIMKREAA